ncbi:hypothetical protein S7711_10654 [Stachybotrys chartarum IBT 7711]|uniref:F-box domain-containing protein n=1 Tax=Stachybotrys chartarum (strain CBS 109288 / IBT 7711) TaxID=1280523 RepID=A0A084B2I3_STACB|nr:hypothetical protein S7711_10654 [Stachybotrys chartarum IBT 7711]
MGSLHPRNSSKTITSPLQLREILGLVREYVDAPSFAALSRTCRDVRIAGTEILYQSVSLDLSGGHGNQLDLFCDTITNNSYLALSVKQLRLQLCEAASASIYATAQDLPDAQTLTKILRATENVTTLYIDYPYHESTASQPCGRDLVFPQNLRLLEFYVRDRKRCPHIPGERDVNTLLLPHVLSMDAVSNIMMTLQQGPGSPLPTAHLPVQSSITSLTLKDAYLSMESLTNVLQALPHLQHLSILFLWYADPVNLDVGRHLDCEKLGHALMREGPSSLETLAIAVQFESRSAIEVECGSGEGSSWGLLHSLGSLQQLNRLRSLELAPEVLLGWGDVDETLPLSLLLPDSLQDLHLRMDFSAWELSPWGFEQLCELLGAYLDSISPETLRRLTLACCEGGEEEVQASLGPIKSKCDKAGCKFRLEMAEDKLKLTF